MNPPKLAKLCCHILKIFFVGNSKALADAQAELEAQSASAGKESVQRQSCSALSEVIKCLRLKDENAELKRKVEALEEQVRSSQATPASAAKSRKSEIENLAP